MENGILFICLIGINIQKYIENSKNLTAENSSIKNWAEDHNRYLFKEDTQMETVLNISITSHQGKSNQNHEI